LKAARWIKRSSEGRARLAEWQKNGVFAAILWDYDLSININELADFRHVAR
jgi:hypothetical protein